MADNEVELPWLDERLSINEAVEAIARTSQDDFETLSDRISSLERRISDLEDATSIECPSCGQTDDVLKSGVAAGKLANNGALTDRTIDALNRDSHVCLACKQAFTPWQTDQQGGG